MRLSDYDQAINFFKKSISLNPNFSQAYNNLGLAYKNKGYLRESLNCFDKAIELNLNMLKHIIILEIVIYC